MHKKVKTKTIYFQLSFFIWIYNKFSNAHPLFCILSSKTYWYSHVSGLQLNMEEVLLRPDLSKGSIYNEVMGTGDRNEKSSLGLGASICILSHNTKMSLILFKFEAPNVGSVWGALIILRKAVCYNYPLPCTPGFKTVSFSKSRIPRITHSYSHYKKYSF